MRYLRSDSHLNVWYKNVSWETMAIVSVLCTETKYLSSTIADLMSKSNVITRTRLEAIMNEGMTWLEVKTTRHPRLGLRIFTQQYISGGE